MELHMQRNAHAITVAMVWLSLTAGSVLAQGPRVRAEIEPSSVGVGETATLAVSLDGDATGRPEVPLVDGLAIQGLGRRQMSRIVNGRRQDTLTFTFAVTPKRVGEFEIGPIRWAGGTTAARLEVAASAPAASQPGPGTTARPSALPPAFLRVLPETTDAVVGQKVPVEIQAWCPAGVEGSIEALPSFEGSAFVLEPLSGEAERRAARRGGEDYTVLVWHSMLTPIRAGDHPLDARMDVTFLVPDEARRSRLGGRRSGSPFGSLFDDSFFGGSSPFGDSLFDSVFAPQRRVPVELVDDRGTEMHVAALTGAPSGFDGAVGRFSVSAATSAREVVEGDPVMVEVVVRGQGAFDRVRAPHPTDSTGLVVHDADGTFEPDAGRSDSGVKRFRIPVEIDSATVEAIPSFRLTYYDPDTERFETAETEAIPIRVRPAPPGERRAAPPMLGDAAGRGAAPREDGRLAPLEDFGSAAASTAERHLVAQRWAWLLLALGAGAVLVRAALAWRDRDPRARALRRALAGLSRARRRDDPQQIATALRAVVETARVRFEDPGLGRDVLVRVDAVLFGAASIDREGLEDLERELRIELDAARGDASSGGHLRPAGAALACVFLLPLAAPLAAQSPGAAHEDRFAVGVAALESGDPAGAVAEFDQVEVARGPSVALLFDRGLAHAALGEHGRAVADLERAHALAPRRGAISAALDAERAAAGLGAGPERGWTHWLTAEEWSWLALLCGAVGLVALWRLTRGGRLGAAAVITAAALLATGAELAGGDVGAVLQRGAVVVEGTALRVSPIDDAAALSELPAGCVLELDGAHADYRRVVTPSGQSGWVRATDLRALVPGADAPDHGEVAS